MGPKKTFIIGAMVMFGSALWATLMSQDYKLVIAMLSAPSLLAGYIFASTISQYIWGMLLGIFAYMLVEYQLYGPVYEITGLIYAVGFILAACFALSACLVHSLKAKGKQG